MLKAPENLDYESELAFYGMKKAVLPNRDMPITYYGFELSVKKYFKFMNVAPENEDDFCDLESTLSNHNINKKLNKAHVSKYHHDYYDEREEDNDKHKVFIGFLVVSEEGNPQVFDMEHATKKLNKIVAKLGISPTYKFAIMKQDCGCCS